MDASESSPQQGDRLVGSIDEEIAVDRVPLRREKRRMHKTFSKQPSRSRVDCCSIGGYGPIGDQEDHILVDPRPYLGLYDSPLPFCGCGLGWFLFLLGFVIPLAWLYASYMFYSAAHEHDPRERPGLAACAVAAIVTASAALFIGVVLFLAKF